MLQIEAISQGATVSNFLLALVLTTGDVVEILMNPSSDVLMIDYNQQLVVFSSNCDYRLQTSLIDCCQIIKKFQM